MKPQTIITLLLVACTSLADQNDEIRKSKPVMTSLERRLDASKSNKRESNKASKLSRSRRSKQSHNQQANEDIELTDEMDVDSTHVEQITDEIDVDFTHVKQLTDEIVVESIHVERVDEIGAESKNVQVGDEKNIESTHVELLVDQIDVESMHAEIAYETGVEFSVDDETKLVEVANGRSGSTESGETIITQHLRTAEDVGVTQILENVDKEDNKNGRLRRNLFVGTIFGILAILIIIVDLVATKKRRRADSDTSGRIVLDSTEISSVERVRQDEEASINASQDANDTDYSCGDLFGVTNCSA